MPRGVRGDLGFDVKGGAASLALDRRSVYKRAAKPLRST
jgi:hypothetical protein